MFVEVEDCITAGKEGNDEMFEGSSESYGSLIHLAADVIETKLKVAHSPNQARRSGRLFRSPVVRIIQDTHARDSQSKYIDIQHPYVALYT